MSSVIHVTSVNYPESDGKPMGETDLHRKEMIRVIELLDRFFAGRQTYVSGDLLLYYERGNPKKFVVPDCFVVKDLEPGDRRVYKLWVERKTPDAILEVTSRKTKKKDTVTNPPLYARLGVKEYFLFDPTRDYLEPPLQGYRLAGAEYEPLVADAQESLVSEQLALRLQAEQTHLVFYRLDTGERLLTAEEACQAAEQARRAEAEARRAEAEARQAEAEARRAEAEARRAAEAEVARLRAELRRRGTTDPKLERS
jgi:Uma2 family endonuclease